MPKPYPKEFRDDVVAVARRVEAPLTQIAKDWVCRWSWPRRADGVGPTIDLLLLAFVVSCKDIDEGLLGGSEIKGGTV